MDTLIKVLSSIGASQYVVIFLVLSIFIDISPIKLNPVKRVVEYFGNCFNRSIEKSIAEFKKETNERLDALQAEQNAQRDTLNKIIVDRDNSELSRIRWDVIDFENSIFNGEKHSREQYRHILDESRKFTRMIETSEVDGISVKEEDVIKMKEAAETIRSHYEKHRVDQSVMYF